MINIELIFWVLLTIVLVFIVYSFYHQYVIRRKTTLFLRGKNIYISDKCKNNDTLFVAKLEQLKSNTTSLDKKEFTQCCFLLVAEKIYLNCFCGLVILIGIIGTICLYFKRDELPSFFVEYDLLLSMMLLIITSIISFVIYIRLSLIVYRNDPSKVVETQTFLLVDRFQQITNNCTDNYDVKEKATKLWHMLKTLIIVSILMATFIFVACIVTARSNETTFST